MDKKINYQFKLIYTISIIFIVAGHCNGGGVSFFSEWFPYYSFHLAIFSFASGYFYSKNSVNNITHFVLHKMYKLLLPLYIYNFIYGVIVTISRYFGFSIGGDFSLYNLIIMPIIDGQQFSYNLGGWFIVPLFCIQIINVLMRKIMKRIKNDWIFFIFFLCLGMIGLETAVKGSYHSWYGLFIDRICYLLPFFGFGTLYKSTIEKEDQMSSYLLFAVLFGLSLTIITYYKKNVFYYPSTCRNFDNILTPYVVAFIGIFFWLRVTRILCPLLKKSSLLMKIADSTYSIMINQFIFMMIVKTIPAIINKLSSGSICNGFNWTRYKSDLWYTYLPYGLEQWNIVYLIAGVLGPVLLQDFINFIIKDFKRNIQIKGLKKM